MLPSPQQPPVDDYLAPSSHGHQDDYQPSYSRDHLLGQQQPVPMSELRPGQALPVHFGGGGVGSPFASGALPSPYAPPLPPVSSSAYGYPPAPPSAISNGYGAQLQGPVAGGSAGAWGMARDRLLKRRSVRHVELKAGNLVLDIPVPHQIVPKGEQRGPSPPSLSLHPFLRSAAADAPARATRRGDDQDALHGRDVRPGRL